ncbi:dihydrolipoamide dehydrogenase [Salibacterium salarium]|uniref:dihydrolipoyl dehydrogenase n=1 Tax=Salibacterium salarium TaxID=284579 RepID=UPI0027852B5D|nr:dihydrolipoyl dehydrogenase [Salibacterium salarium]MDQ0299562.1 dihydrolipoamide dehydrogenase [Salibacterium salarium]
MPEEYDVVILGAGTGGYVTAIKAAQEGLKTAIVEKDKVGGTCLHKGCIPSKSLLRSAEVYSELKNSEQYGITANDVSIQFDKVQARKDMIVQQLHHGVEQLMQKGKIDIYQGHGRILGSSIFSPISGTISVEMEDGSENIMLLPKNVIVATGSRPKTFSDLKPDGDQVMTSDEALNLDELPKSIIIVGGGVIGIEFASMMSDFEVDVTIVEYASSILPGEDEAISEHMKKTLENRGVKVLTNANIRPEKTQKSDVVTLTLDDEGKELEISAEKVLLSIGRKANIEDIGLENTEIETNNECIVTNQHYQSKESHIYAIGDVIGGMQLAHVASHEGLIAINHIINNSPSPIDSTMIPRCTYSRPEVASIGLTETQARQQGYSVKTGSVSFRSNGKALVFGDTEGFTKFIINEQNDDLLGVHMIGAHVTELISEASLAKLIDASNLEISETIHPHPSLSELIGEAALAVEGKAIHS